MTCLISARTNYSDLTRNGVVTKMADGFYYEGLTREVVHHDDRVNPPTSACERGLSLSRLPFSLSRLRFDFASW